MQPLAQLGRVVFALRAAFANQHRAGRDHGDSARPTSFQGTRIVCVGIGTVNEAVLPLNEAVAIAATGDIWLFRGTWLRDRTIRPPPPGACATASAPGSASSRGDPAPPGGQVDGVIERFDGRPFPTALRIELVAPYALAREIAVR